MNTVTDQDTAGRRDPTWRRLLSGVVTVVVVILTLWSALAIHYWVPWPVWVRNVGPIIWGVLILGLWFAPSATRRIRRTVASVLLLALIAAYVVKTPAPQDWRDLHSQEASVIFDGDRATILNYRDALHVSGQTSTPRWTAATFDLSQLEGLDLILQPFGNVKALEHVMLSFRFADGSHVVISMEARQAKGAEFDALAGFFRRDPLYPELATERDLFWERMSRVPPDQIQIIPIRQSPEVLRVYLKRILLFVNAVHTRPKFYSTLSESCMTSFINLAPERFASVPWYDLRRWIPGYALSLFQQQGLVDARLSPDQLAQTRRLPADVLPPTAFPDDASWSAYVRTRLPQPPA
jgi:hypothetical protein